MAKTISIRDHFDSYINSAFYEKKLFHAAAQEAMKDISCGEPAPRVMRTRMKVVEGVRFAHKRAHPVKGVWREETHVILCGKSADINVTIVATPNGAPAFLAKED